MTLQDPVFLRRVLLSNYRSIHACDVSLGPMAFLVGPNGSGKSNFLDALRLVTDSLNTSLDHALRERGGINDVRRRSSGHPTNFRIHLEWKLPDGGSGVYAFRVGAQPKGGFEVLEERLRFFEKDPLAPEQFYVVERGAVTKCSFSFFPVASSDRLYLVAASGLPPFRRLYEALCHMGFYNLNPDSIRALQPPDPGDVLKRDGGNLASVLSTMSKKKPESHKRVIEHLGMVVPGITSVEVKHIASKETLEFRQVVGKNNDSWRFGPENMSDGTLRALGVLTALFQTEAGNGNLHRVPFVGIEEPEVAVHPGAAGLLRDALGSAAAQAQVVVTSHSPDLLDDKDIPEESILAVVNRNGETTIGQLDPAGRQAIKERLYTAGELLRMNQLEPAERENGSLVPDGDPVADYAP